MVSSPLFSNHGRIRDSSLSCFAGVTMRQDAAGILIQASGSLARTLVICCLIDPASGLVYRNNLTEVWSPYGCVVGGPEGRQTRRSLVLQRRVLRALVFSIPGLACCSSVSLAGLRACDYLSPADRGPRLRLCGGRKRQAPSGRRGHRNFSAWRCA